jgi:hypothetical protein
MTSPVDEPKDAPAEAEVAEAVDPRAFHDSVLAPLFEGTARTSAFDLACTLLRVGGLEMEDWDAFNETRAAVGDYNWILGEVRKRSIISARRVGLLMYCQAVEMNAVHEILVNLLRSRANLPYATAPLRSLGHNPKKSGLGLFTGYRPPSATRKFKVICQLAERVGYPELNTAIDRFFDERMRNAFSHSDYILTDSYFRLREGGVAQQIDVQELDRRLTECFAFYGAFLDLHDDWIHALGRGKRFHRWPNYEVLELLSSEDEGLYGFNVHFSNGAKATYMRRKASGTRGSANIMFDAGGVNFFVGNLETLEKVWKIDGKPVDDWSSLP